MEGILSQSAPYCYGLGKKNCNVALCMCTSTAISNCSGERSFSVSNRATNYLRSTSNQKRKSDLALLHIEAELLFELEIKDIILRVIQAKDRKKVFL